MAKAWDLLCDMTVPVETLRAADDLVAEFQRVILAMLGRRAGAPPPELH